jgi:hypothetical protein
MDWEALYRNLKAVNWVCLFLFGSISFFLMSHTFTSGIIAGGLLVIANFHIFQKTIRQVFMAEGSGKARKAPVIAKYYLRLSAMGLLIYFFIAEEWVHPVGFAVGLSIVVISITILGIHLLRRTLSGEMT